MSNSSSFQLYYKTCRNISTPADEKLGIKTYVGYASIEAFQGLNDNKNVRDYYPDAGKKKTTVHQAIRDTLENRPQDLPYLSNGFVIVATSANVDDKNKVMSLAGESRINGTQTQGEITRYLEKQCDFLADQPNIFYKILVIPDNPDLVSEISIASNFQNMVKPISIAGQRDQLDELQEAFQKGYPDLKLRMSETDVGDQFVDTEKLIQVLFALMPDAVTEDYLSTNKVFTYSQKMKCLRLFQQMHENKDTDPSTSAYEYFLNMAAEAWRIYLEWKTHPAFQGCGIRSIQRDGSTVIDVPDGIVFPILASLSVFVKWNKRIGRWCLRMPIQLEPKEIVATAKELYQDVAGSNPQVMGKTQACYSGLKRMTSIYAKLS